MAGEIDTFPRTHTELQRPRLFPPKAATILTTEPVDQASPIGMSNHMVMLGLSLGSVECLPAEGVQL